MLSLCQVLLIIFSDLGFAGQFGLGGAATAVAQPYAALQAAAPTTPFAAAATAAAGSAAPGKARSSMNLGMISGR